MVIKGNPRGSPAGLAKHLQRTDTNERVEILQLRGVAANDLAGALHEMDAFGAALRTHRTLYHASINIRADEQLTPAQRTQAIDRLESALGLTGQPRAIVEHEKQGRAGEGRTHWHVVWSRADLEHMRAIRCDHNYRTHELVAREMEREFGHARVQGVHVERDGPNGERIIRPDRTPSHAEMQQAQRNGIDPHQMKAEITGLWRATDSGKAFAAALEQQGYVLARGDRRDFVVIDRQGEVHSLARRIEGRDGQGRARLHVADLDRGCRCLMSRRPRRSSSLPNLPGPIARPNRREHPRRHGSRADEKHEGRWRRPRSAARRRRRRRCWASCWDVRAGSARCDHPPIRPLPWWVVLCGGPARWRALQRDCSRRLSRQRRSKPNKTRVRQRKRTGGQRSGHTSPS